MSPTARVTPEQLRVEADRLEQARAAHQAGLAERDARRRAAVAMCEREAVAFRAEMDAVLAEVRATLPGCERWWPRLAEALRRYDVATAEARAANMSVGATWRPSTLLQQHRVNRLSDLLQMLQE